MKNLLLLLLLPFFTTRLLMAGDFNIVDYGAVSGSNATAALQKAVDACHAAGGGRVIVPAGRFITGTVELRSYVDLHLEQGALLLGSTDLADYTRSFRRHGMLYAYDAVQVSVTGEGIMDGRGTNFYDTTRSHVTPDFDRQFTRQKDRYLPEGEFFSDGPIRRIGAPGMTITFYHCSQVTLQDFTLRDTPIWAVRFAYCEDVLVEGISILNNLMVPNSDGLHCTASRNVRIANCDIRAGDDAIIFTGFDIEEERPGYDTTAQAARRYGNKSVYAENLNVTNCQLQSRSSGIRIGYGQHPIRRCVFTNLIIYGSNRGIGIFARDAADISDLIFSDIIIDTRLHNGHWWGNGEPIHLSSISRFSGHPAGTIRRVRFDNIIATGEHGLLVYGEPGSPLQDISFERIQLRINKGPETLAYGGNIDLRPNPQKEKQVFARDIPGLLAQHVDGLVIRDFTLSWGDGLPAFFTHGIECRQVRRLDIRNFQGSANPGAPDALKVRLEETTAAE
jgi:hypothetical protein